MTTKKKKQEKPQGALTPLLFSLPLGSKIYYSLVKVRDLSYLLRVCDDNINQDMTCLITLFVRDEERDEIIILIIA